MEQNTEIGAPMSPAVDNKQKNINGLKIATVIACVVAVCGIGFGVYGIIDNVNKKQEIDNLRQQINNTSQIQDSGIMGDDITISEAEKLVSKYTSLMNVTGVCPTQVDIQLTEETMVARAVNLAIEQNALTPISEDMRDWYTMDYGLLNAVYKELFGKSLDIEKQDYEFEGYFPMSLSYDGSNDTFKVEYANGVGGCVGETARLANVVWAQKINDAINVVVDFTEIDLGAYSSTGKLDENEGDIKIGSYLYKFVDDGGYVLKEITKIR